MKTHIGLIGPRDSVRLVVETAKEFAGRLELHPFVYGDVDEVPGLVEQNRDAADIWIFTGVVSYELALPALQGKTALLISSSGSALMKLLFRMHREDGISLERLSIDTLQADEVHETFRELGLPVGSLHIDSRTGATPTAELVAFHEELYRKGMTDACITHRSYVYEQLKKKQIPAYRIVATKAAVRQTLRLACQRGETDHFRKSQIAVIRVDAHGTHVNSYDAYRLNLDVQRLLLSAAESVAGSIIPEGSGRYILVSTRGALEQPFAFRPADLLQKIKLITDSPVNIGIGYGSTARGAEQNAALALGYAQSKGGDRLAIADENGSLTEPQTEGALPLFYRTDDMEIAGRLKQEGISVTTYRKIISVQDSLGKGCVTAADVAEWLRMTRRNANRILTGLERCGLARAAGQESPADKGRPRKLFRVGPAPEQESIP